MWTLPADRVLWLSLAVAGQQAELIWLGKVVLSCGNWSAGVTNWGTGVTKVLGLFNIAPGTAAGGISLWCEGFFQGQASLIPDWKL